MPADPLTDGYQLLARIPIDELERRVAWLEDALAAHKTMLVVRQVMAGKPDGFEVPEFSPIVEEKPAVVEMSGTDAVKRIREWMGQQTQTVTPKQIAVGTGLTDSWVSKVLREHRDVFFERVMHGQWRLHANGKSVAGNNEQPND